MKRFVMLAALMSVLTSSVAMAADTATLLADAAKKADGMVVGIRFKVPTAGEPQIATAAGACVDPSGVFIVFGIDAGATVVKSPTSKPAVGGPLQITDLQIVLPGIDGATFNAEILSQDPETGITFVRDLDKKRKWTAMEFATGDLKVGQQVASAGLMPGEASLPIYVAAGNISTQLRMPEKMYYVTGELTTGCSPVFDESLKVVGLVMPTEPSQATEMFTQQGNMVVGLRNRLVRKYFLAADELTYTIKHMEKAHEAPWIGVMEFKGADKGVELARVLPDQPAAKAGLKDGDVVTALDNQPLEKFSTPQATVSAFNRRIGHTDAGATITLTVRGKDGAERPVPVKTEPTPAAPRQYVSQPLQIVVRDKVLLDKYYMVGKAAGATGVIVRNVGRNGPAMDLAQDNVLTTINGQPVTSVKDFEKLVEAGIASGKQIVVDGIRKDTPFQVKVTPPAPTTRP